jgi:subtilase family serine protease
MRAVPDVSYDADPQSGFPIYHAGKWREVGGTSAGAPQWAAIAALGSGISLPQLYADKAASSNSNYFRDITSGTNGSCGYLCSARKHYDYVTGLGSPQTINF